MGSDRSELDWTPQGRVTLSGRREGARHPGPRWVISLRALVVVLAMLAAALGVLWLESASVQGASAQLNNEGAGKVVVPPLGSPAPTAGSTADVDATTGADGSGGSSKGTDGLQGGDDSKSTAGAVAPGSVVVHVAGAVRNPGVFTLPAGSRVFQGVEAAGGALPGAGLSALNLAAPLTDGIQILVPTIEEAATAVRPPEAAAASPSQVALINLNTASATDIESLPGVGPVLAGRIVAWRRDHGPFTSVEGLSAVTGIGPKLLAGLHDLVVVS